MSTSTATAPRDLDNAQLTTIFLGINSPIQIGTPDIYFEVATGSLAIARIKPAKPTTARRRSAQLDRRCSATIGGAGLKGLEDVLDLQARNLSLQHQPGQGRRGPAEGHGLDEGAALRRHRRLRGRG